MGYLVPFLPSGSDFAQKNPPAGRFYTVWPASIPGGSRTLQVSLIFISLGIATSLGLFPSLGVATVDHHVMCIDLVLVLRYMHFLTQPSSFIQA